MKELALLAFFAGSLTTVGCAGVSRDYVAVNAATIHTDSESTLTTLEGMTCAAAPAPAPAPAAPAPAPPAEAGPELCTIKKPALDALKEDQRQISERAKNLCTAAKSDCTPTEVP